MTNKQAFADHMRTTAPLEKALTANPDVSGVSSDPTGAASSVSGNGLECAGGADPFFITGPALISFSGGRTSAYMLWRILQAHGGILPDDIHVVFANTGKEREETLRFVHECSARWGVRVRWLEWRSRLKSVPVTERYEEVGFNSASRNGEPFEALIRSKKSTPNIVHGWCTEHLKVQVCDNFMEAQGFTHWANVIGLRADELRRVVKKDRQNEEGKSRWANAMPLVRARVVKDHVRLFWFGTMKPSEAVQMQRDFGSIATVTLPQGFDLGLEEWEGNCTLCFKVGYKLLLHRIRRMPDEPLWWSRMERIGNGTFTTEYSYEDLQRAALNSPLLDLGDNFASDAECGVGGADYSIRCGKAA